MTILVSVVIMIAVLFSIFRFAFRIVRLIHKPKRTPELVQPGTPAQPGQSVAPPPRNQAVASAPRNWPANIPKLYPDLTTQQLCQFLTNEEYQAR